VRAVQADNLLRSNLSGGRRKTGPVPPGRPDGRILLSVWPDPPPVCPLPENKPSRRPSLAAAWWRGICSKVDRVYLDMVAPVLDAPS